MHVLEATESLTKMVLLRCKFYLNTKSLNEHALQRLHQTTGGFLCRPENVQVPHKVQRTGRRGLLGGMALPGWRSRRRLVSELDDGSGADDTDPFMSINWI